MTSPLERAARALWIASGKRAELWDAPPTALWRIEMDKERPIYLDQARAVLTAIRFAPDDDFFALAGEELPPEFQSRGDKGVIACTIWQAMIDAALSEKPE